MKNIIKKTSLLVLTLATIGASVGMGLNVSKSEIHNKQEIEFDQDFFKGRKVIVFDDILTKGFAYAIFANKIEKMGAEVLGGLFIGKTVYSN